MALPLYALTLFVSAFILFLVQPIVGKIILPKLGGTPQVWNTCMVFFQMVLLAGYAYTHNVSTRLNLRQQLTAHAVLLILPLIVLLPFPFAFGGGALNEAGQVTNPNSLWGFVPELGSNPIPSTLAILFLYVALPFLVVSTSAPLLQKWFVYTGHPASKDPYFLYGASNLGSLLSLIVYPILIEPYISLQTQGWIYTAGYISLTLFIAACAAMVWQAKEPASLKPLAQPKLDLAPAAPSAPAPTAETQTGITAAAPTTTGVKPGQPGKFAKTGGRSIATETPSHVASDEMTFGRRFRWVMLAAIPSSLMLGITTHITTDLSPIPLFWLVPLILYLLSFILVFARWPVVWTERPHMYFLYIQPFAVWFMIMTDVWNLTSSPAFIGFAIFAHVTGFFATTMVCHGEMAKDRPSTRHLTEFFLWMSVGGMVGGMFNALIAPVVFTKMWEFPLAIFAAGLVRPRMFETGLFDNLLAGMFEGAPDQTPAHKPGQKGAKPAVVATRGGVTANESLVGTLDFVWPVAILLLCGLLAFVPGPAEWLTSKFFSRANEASSILTFIFIFGIPLLLACLCMWRPLRIGLGIGAVLLVHQIYQGQHDTASIFRGRSYFGAISVKQERRVKEAGGKNQDFYFRGLIHGHIDHGMNFVAPEKAQDRGNVDIDFSRLATTYYHREGPVGRVMEKYNWFPGKQNTFHADARIVASLVGNALVDVGTGALPITNLATAWSEPPLATVGLGTGTMASYGRPYQHVHFYEIDNQIRRLSLPESSIFLGDWEKYKKSKSESRREIYFSYLEQAIERGSTVQVLMGDARLRMALPYMNHYSDLTEKGGGPDNFYHMMVVDAFSSDAIPAHLLTEQAFEMYFRKLTKEGVLCVHTSNRFVDLPKVVAAVSKKLGLKHRRGHDINDNRSNGHYTSEWVMVARDTSYILKADDAEFLARYNQETANKRRGEEYWSSTKINDRYIWTDDYYNLMSVVRWPWRRED